QESVRENMDCNASPPAHEAKVVTERAAHVDIRTAGLRHGRSQLRKGVGDHEYEDSDAQPDEVDEHRLPEPTGGRPGGAHDAYTHGVADDHRYPESEPENSQQATAWCSDRSDARHTLPLDRSRGFFGVKRLIAP